ncbi:unnamed protein product [Closterium sp. NIES-54]
MTEHTEECSADCTAAMASGNMAVHSWLLREKSRTEAAAAGAGDGDAADGAADGADAGDVAGAGAGSAPGEADGATGDANAAALSTAESAILPLSVDGNGTSADEVAHTCICTR